MIIQPNFDNKNSIKTDIIIKIICAVAILYILTILLGTLILSDFIKEYLMNNYTNAYYDILNIGISKILWYIIIVYISLGVVLIGGLALFMWKILTEKARMLNGLRIHIDYLINGIYYNAVKNKYIIRKDEIGAISRAVVNLQDATIDMVGDIKYSTNIINNQSSNLTKVSEELTKVVTNISSSIKYINSMMSHEAIDINDIVQKVNEFTGYIEGTIREIDILSDMTETINNNTNESYIDIKNLNKSFELFNTIFQQFIITLNIMNSNLEKVSEITEFINNMAGKTNLLALNATIEARKAGEAGKGFSVVADEIRELAEKTKESSIRINSLTKGILKSSNDLGLKTEEMNCELENQKESVDKTLESFSLTSKLIKEMNPKVNTLANSSHTIQLSNISILNKIQNLYSVNREIYTATSEITKASQGMKELSQWVLNTVHELNKIVDITKEYVDKFRLDDPFNEF